MKDYLQFFKDSYERAVHGQDDDFFDAFYDCFLNSSPVAREIFANTDMSRQRDMLRQSFWHMVTFSEKRQASEELRDVAAIHSRRDLNIAAPLYDIWLDSLIEAVRLFDTQFSDEVELAWRVVLAPGIAYMRFRYDHA
jgi:hemoglobin-like flavoprotein